MGMWRDDSGESSIMQTISVAVSLVLIAAAFLIVPNMISTAKDDNAKVDISNIALAENASFANTGKYFAGVDIKNMEPLVAGLGIKVILGARITGREVSVCDSPESYLIKATSSTGTVFFRSSFSGTTSSDISQIRVPQCIPVEFYEPTTPVVPSKPDPAPAPPVIVPSGPDDTSPLITISPASASVSYTVVPNSYNVLQIKLNNVTLTNSSVEKQDWEIRVNKLAYPLNRFASVGAISVEDGRVTCTDKVTYYSCVNNQTGPYGNGISSGSSFSMGIVVNATLNFVDNVTVAQDTPSGGAWYATQDVTVSTTYPVYGYWKTRIDFSALKNTGSKGTYLCINDGNVSITHDTGNWYWVQGITDYFTIKADAPRTFQAARVTVNSGSCTNE